MSDFDKKDFETSKLIYLISEKSCELDDLTASEALEQARVFIADLLSFSEGLKNFAYKKNNIKEFLSSFDLDFIRTQFASTKNFRNDFEVYLYAFFISDSKNIINNPFVYLKLIDPNIKELIAKKIFVPTNYSLWLLLLESKQIAIPEKFISNGHSNIVTYEQLLGYKNTPFYYFLFRVLLIGRGVISKDDRCIIKNVNNISFPLYSKIKLSIIIPVYGAFELLNQCLISISRTDLTDYEIICVDDCAPSNTPTDYKSYENIRIIRNNSNQGFSNTCNLGVKHANGEYVLLLNSDTIVINNSIENALNKFISDPKIGIVGSKLINIDGSLQEAGGVIWSNTLVENFMRGKSLYIPYVEFDRETGYVSGAALFAKKKVWSELGGFNQKFTPAYYEDTDLCVRARSKGYKVIYCHDSEIIHAEGGTNGTDLSVGIKNYQQKNKNKFSLLWKKYIEKTFPVEGDSFAVLANGRKIVVLVDHYVPKVASDAGSKAMHHLIDYLIERNYFIILWPDNLYPDDISRKIIAKKGVMTVYGSEFINKFGSFIKIFEKHIDKIILSRPHIAINYISQIKGSLIDKTVYLGHDIHYERMTRQNKITFNSNYIFFADNEVIKKTRIQEYSLWKMCNKTAYFTRREAEIVNTILKQEKAVVIPLFKNEIIKFKYNKTDKVNKTSNFLFVGGFDHQPNKDGLLWLLEGLDKNGKDLLEKIVIVGSKIPQEVKLLLNNKKINFFEDVSNERLDEIYSTTSVVIAPLRFGSGFKGKVLEAVQRKIPVVTTSIGLEGFELNDDVKPFNDIIGFIQQMRLLESSNSAREKIIIHQYKMLEQYFETAKYSNIF